MDDLLKSVKDVSTTVKLVKDVIKMCSDGSFHLTKFISNEMKVLSSIPIEDWRRGVKDVQGYFRNWGQHPEDTEKGIFHYSKVKKGTPNLTSPYVHRLFTIVLIE